MAKATVALVVHDGVQALDIAGPLDVFAEADGLLGETAGGYACLLLASRRAALRASNGVTLVPDLALADAQARFDIALVAGGPALPQATPDPEVTAWLRRWGRQAGRYGAICTGAFTLGHAGLLDGRAVTTHWANADALATAFPAARVEPDRIYARDGRLITSAGVTAGIDLALGLVAEDHGPELALACAKRLVVVAQRQGGQSQFSPLLTVPQQGGSPLGKVLAYVHEHLEEALPVSRLAQIAGTSPRTVARMFVAEIGVTPHAFVEQARLDRARHLLEATGQALKAVAFDCGFASPEQMRCAFQRRFGTSPAAYRETFRLPTPRRTAP